MSSAVGRRTLLDAVYDGAWFVVVFVALVSTAALVLSGCASKPVSIVVDKGLIQIDGVGLVSGERVRYRSGLLEAGEAGVTFDGKASGFPTTGPAPKPEPKPPE